eukprot:12255241-Alexandrium_andersonii.AAC.1
MAKLQSNIMTLRPWRQATAMDSLARNDITYLVTPCSATTTTNAALAITLLNAQGGGSPPGEQREVWGAAAPRAGAGNAQE